MDLIKFTMTDSKYHGSAHAEVLDCTKCAHFPDTIGAACGVCDVQFDSIRFDSISRTSEDDILFIFKYKQYKFILHLCSAVANHAPY